MLCQHQRRFPSIRSSGWWSSCCRAARPSRSRWRSRASPRVAVATFCSRERATSRSATPRRRHRLRCRRCCRAARQRPSRRLTRRSFPRCARRLRHKAHRPWSRRLRRQCHRRRYRLAAPRCSRCRCSRRRRRRWKSRGHSQSRSPSPSPSPRLDAPVILNGRRVRHTYDSNGTRLALELRNLF